MTHQDTKERILEAAEVLFAQRGYDGASLREITSRAGTNLAAANYHFGSKEGLLGAVFERRMEDLNAERLRRLDALEAAGPGGPLDLAEVVEVFVGPALELAGDTEHGGAHFLRIVGRAHSETAGPLRTVIESGVFDKVRRRFQTAFGRILPRLAEEDVLWRMHFAIGAMVHAILHAETIAAVSGGLCDAGDHRALSSQLVTFLTGGLSAPPPERTRGSRARRPRFTRREP